MRFQSSFHIMNHNSSMSNLMYIRRSNRGISHSTTLNIIKKLSKYFINLLNFQINIYLEGRKYNLKKNLSNYHILNHNFSIFCLILLEKFFRDILKRTF
jgi:hypothetical protein